VKYVRRRGRRWSWPEWSCPDGTATCVVCAMVVIIDLCDFWVGIRGVWGSVECG
jgi:hypothetical protein